MKINWIEFKESSIGNKYARASIINDEGKEIKDVAIFSKFPNFSTLAAGQEVKGVIKEKDYNGKPSYSLEEERTVGFNKGPNAQFKAAQINQAMEKKQEGIAKSQDRKEESIMHASIMRDASLITSAQIHGKGLQTAEVELIWKHWQDFIENQWKQPFN